MFIKDWKDFETVIDTANAQYEALKKGIIQRIPTPWKVIRAWDMKTKKNVIYRAFPLEKSTVDFGGTASGFSIWFDAKSSKHEKYFKIDNIKDHQIDFLKAVREHGGKAFFLVYVQPLQKVFLLWLTDLERFIEEEKRKSIPYEWLESNCKQVDGNENIFLDYLSEVLI
jgi:recombination protein U